MKQIKNYYIKNGAKLKPQKIKITSFVAFSTTKTGNYRPDPAANNLNAKTQYITCQLHS